MRGAQEKERTAVRIDEMSLPEAIEWARGAANEIVGTTVWVGLEGGQMEADNLGASRATYWPLASYLALPSDADISVHAAAIETLRQHRQTQLDPDAWAAAQSAILGEYKRQTGKDDPPAEIYHPDGSHVGRWQGKGSKEESEGLLKDRTKYRFKESEGKVGMRLPRRRSGPSANKLLRAASIPRSAYEWRRGEGESTKSWLVVDVVWAERIAEALAEHYPNLAEALTQNAPVWKERVGLPQDASPTAAKTTLDPLAGHAPSYKDERYQVHWQWRSEAPTQIRLATPFDISDRVYRAGIQGGRAEREGSLYWRRYMISDVPRIIAIAKETRDAELGEILEELLPAWQTMAGRAAPRSASRGDTESGVAGGIPYKWDADNYRLILDVGRKGLRANEFAARVKGTSGWAKLPDGRYVATVAVRALPDFMTALGEAGMSDVAEGLQPHLDTWQGRRAELTVDREGGQKHEGGWWQVKKEVTRKFDAKKGKMADKVKERVRVYLDYADAFNPKRGGRRPGRLHPPDEHGFYYEMSPRNVPAFADKIVDVFPRLAEALNRAFGGIARVMDAAEIERCRILAQMKDALRPEDVRDPKGQAEIRRLQKAFAKSTTPLRPYPHQWVGIAYAALNDYRALIGDPTGVGKTATAIGALIADGNRLLPAIVVAPENTLYSAWGRELSEWLPGVHIHIIQGRSSFPPKRPNQVVIMGWASLARYQDKIIDYGFSTAIFDEAHKAKAGKRSQRGAAFLAVSAAVPHLLLLTATPVMNRVSELFPLLKALHPDDWGTFKEFRRKYAGTLKAIKAGEAVITQEQGLNLDETAQLKLRLACTMIRRPKRKVLKDLPPKRVRQRNVPLTAAQEAEFAKAEDEFFSWYENQLRERLGAEVKRAAAAAGVSVRDLSPEQKTAIAEAARERVEKAMEAEAIVKMGRMRELSGTFKAPAAARMAVDLAKKGEPVIVWIAHKAVGNTVARALKKAGISYAKIVGGISTKEKGRIVKDFQDGKIDVIIASTAAQEGITLTRAAKAIFTERYWNPAAERQAEDRVWRIGQKRDVDIIVLMNDTWIDEYMDDLNRRKAAVVDAILEEGDESVGVEDVPLGEAGLAIMRNLR